MGYFLLARPVGVHGLAVVEVGGGGWSFMRRLQLRFDLDSTAVRLLIKGH